MPSVRRDGGCMNEPQNTGAAFRVTRALHSHASGGIGWTLAVAAALYPPLKLLTDETFVRALVLGDANARTQLIIAIIVALAGATLAYLGKGMFAPAADDTVEPGQDAVARGLPPSAPYSSATIHERESGMQGNLANDGAQLAQQALTALQTAADNILTGASNAIPKLEADAQTFANGFLADRAPAGVRDYFLPILQGAEASAAPAIDKAEKTVQAGIAVFKTDIDSALGHLKSLL